MNNQLQFNNVKELSDYLNTIDDNNNYINYLKDSLKSIDGRIDDGTDSFNYEEERKVYENDLNEYNSKLEEMSKNFDIDEARRFVKLYNDFNSWNFRYEQIKTLINKNGISNVRRDLIDRYNLLYQLIQTNKDEYERLSSLFLKPNLRLEETDNISLDNTDSLEGENVISNPELAVSSEERKSSLNSSEVSSNSLSQLEFIDNEIKSCEQKISKIVFRKPKKNEHVQSFTDKNHNNYYVLGDNVGKFRVFMAELNNLKKKRAKLSKDLNIDSKSNIKNLEDNISEESKLVTSNNTYNNSNSYYDEIDNYMDQQLALSNGKNYDKILLSVGINYGYKNAYEYFNKNCLLLNDEYNDLQRQVMENSDSYKKLSNNMNLYTIGDYSLQKKEIENNLKALSDKLSSVSKKKNLYSLIVNYYKKLIPFENDLLQIKDASLVLGNMNLDENVVSTSMSQSEADKLATMEVKDLNLLSDEEINKSHEIISEDIPVIENAQEEVIPEVIESETLISNDVSEVKPVYVDTTVEVSMPHTYNSVKLNGSFYDYKPVVSPTFVDTTVEDNKAEEEEEEEEEEAAKKAEEEAAKKAEEEAAKKAEEEAKKAEEEAVKKAEEEAAKKAEEEAKKVEENNKGFKQKIFNIINKFKPKDLFKMNSQILSSKKDIAQSIISIYSIDNINKPINLPFEPVQRINDYILSEREKSDISSVGHGDTAEDRKKYWKDNSWDWEKYFKDRGLENQNGRHK